MRTHNIPSCLKNRKDIPIMPSDFAICVTLLSSNYFVSNIFYGSKGVRAIEVLLYLIF